VLHFSPSQSSAASSAFGPRVPVPRRDATRSANPEDTKPAIPTVNCVGLLNCGAAALDVMFVLTPACEVKSSIGRVCNTNRPESLINNNQGGV
jgi:hypothetical protein